MSSTQRLEERIADFYATEAPARAPEWLLTQAFVAIDSTPQRRTGLGLRRRFPSMSPTLAMFGATAALVAAVGVGLALLWGPAIGPVATPSPSASSSPTAPAVSGMWPQSTLEEVRQAQELADAGDPLYTWQVDPDLGGQLGQHHPAGSQLFARFLQVQLGWEEVAWDEAFAHPDGLEDGEVVYIRCAPGGINPLYPDATCGPTIDELHYETVTISAAQPDRTGPSGLWVVTGWEFIEPAAQADPSAEGAEVTALLDGFLQARIDGAGAEDFADFADTDPMASDWKDQAIPLLYATSTGARYVRSEFDLADGPQWPEGWGQVGPLTVRLFTEQDDTVVEQALSMERDETGRLRLVYHPQPFSLDGPLPATTENGQPVPAEYAFLDGAVTYRATYPLEPSVDGYRDEDRLAIDGLLPDDDSPRRVLVLLADPRPIGPDCEVGPAPADAVALAASIASDPDVEAAAPVEVDIGGVTGLRMDVVLRPGATSCSWTEPAMSGTSPLLLEHVPFGGLDRARITLADLPTGSGARVLAIVTVTDEDSFDTVLGFAAPVVDSIGFRAP